MIKPLIYRRSSGSIPNIPNVHNLALQPYGRKYGEDCRAKWLCSALYSLGSAIFLRDCSIALYIRFYLYTEFGVVGVDFFHISFFVVWVVVVFGFVLSVSHSWIDKVMGM